MAILNKTGINPGNLIDAEHVTRIIDSLDGTGTYSVVATGSFTGSFAGDGSQLTGISSSNSVTASFAETASFLLGSIASSSYSDFAVSASYSNFAISSSQATTASFAITASHVPGAIMQNGNRFGTSMIIGTDDNQDVVLQVSGTTAISIESVSTRRGQVNLSFTGSKSGGNINPAISFGTTSDGIGFYDPGDSSGDAVSIIEGLREAASFQLGGSGINSYPVCVLGNRDTFTVNDKWGQPGLHVQNGLVAANEYYSNVFFSGLSSNWRKSSFNCGYWVDPSSTTLNFLSAPTSSVTGSASDGIGPVKFMEIDPNYDNGGNNEPNVKINYRLKIGLLWAGTSTAIGWDAASNQVRYVSSDQRLKTDVQTITSSLDIINQLNGVQFKWTNRSEPEFQISDDSSGPQIGLIAQQVQQVLPQIVKPNGFKDYLTVEYDKLVAVLIEAVKEQQQEINTLKSEIQAIKTHVGM